MDLKAIGTTIGGICIILMQVANIVSTENVENKVKSNGVEFERSQHEFKDEVVQTIQQKQAEILQKILENNTSATNKIAADIEDIDKILREETSREHPQTTNPK